MFSLVSICPHLSEAGGWHSTQMLSCSKLLTQVCVKLSAERLSSCTVNVSS